MIIRDFGLFARLFNTSWPLFVTHCRIVSFQGLRLIVFCVLRQSCCGKFEFSAESGHPGHPLLGCMKLAAHLKRSDHCRSSFYCQPDQLGCTQLYWWSVRYGRRVDGHWLGWLVGWSVEIGKGQQTGSNGLSPPQPQIRLFLPHCPRHQLWRIRFKRQAILLSIEDGKCSKKIFPTLVHSFEKSSSRHWSFHKVR